MGMNMQQLMKQAQKMQRQMEQAQQELAAMELVGESGGGMVKVAVNGMQEILGIKIDPQAVDPEDVEMLEDLILAALRDALGQAQAASQEKMGRAAGGMNLPGMGGMF